MAKVAAAVTPAERGVELVMSRIDNNTREAREEEDGRGAGIQKGIDVRFLFA